MDGGSQPLLGPSNIASASSTEEGEERGYGTVDFAAVRYEHTYVRTYVRTYVGTYVRTYVRMYVPTYVRTYIRTYVRM